MSARFVLCRDRRSFDAELAVARERNVVRDGFEAAQPGIVCVGSLDGERAEGAALLAATHGAALIVLAELRDPSPAFLEDLGRLGLVERRNAKADSSLGPEERRLLELLAEGLSLAEAAERLHMSRRTADRRLRTAREALGARSTVEAVVRLRPEPSARVG